MTKPPKRHVNSRILPTIPMRAVRYVAFLGLRMIWNLFRRVGIVLPVDLFLHHSLDKKTGTHLIDANADHRLLAICDFSSFPLSFDLLTLLVAADNHRRRSGLRWLDFAFIAHDTDPYSDLSNPVNPITRKNYRTFVFNLGLDASRLFEAAGNVLFFSNRKSFEKYLRSSGHRASSLFPESYNIFRPDYCPHHGGPPLYGLIHLFEKSEPREDILSLKAPEACRELVKRRLRKIVGTPTIVTITLREFEYIPKRNSKIPEWQKLIDAFSDRNIKFIVLRDYFEIYSAPVLSGSNVTEYPEAVIDLCLRAALYEIADVNMMSAAGPTALCYLNSNVNYIAFDPCADPEACNEDDMFFQHGIKQGENFLGSGPHQKLIWKEEKFFTLKEELDFFLGELDSSP